MALNVHCRALYRLKLCFHFAVIFGGAGLTLLRNAKMPFTVVDDHAAPQFSSYDIEILFATKHNIKSTRSQYVVTTTQFFTNIFIMSTGLFYADSEAPIVSLSAKNTLINYHHPIYKNMHTICQELHFMVQEPY